MIVGVGSGSGQDFVKEHPMFFVNKIPGDSIDGLYPQKYNVVLGDIILVTVISSQKVIV